MIYPSIRLHKNHIPLNPKLWIKSQKDYDYYIEVLLYLHTQLSLGVKPVFMVTMHYQHPVEHSKPLKETDKPYGFGDRYGFKTKRNIWNEVSLYKYWEKKRNEEDQVIKDTQKVKCRILKKLYDVKRMNRPDKYDLPNILFFHEKGKTKLQYHTHILLTGEKLNTLDLDDLKDIFNTSIREETKCISRWKHIDIRPVKSPQDVVSYLNKETCSSHLSFDFMNSNPITTIQTK